MSGGASGGRWAALLQLAVVLVLGASLVQGQLISIAGCQNFQTSPKFNADYVAKLTAETDGYSMLLTSDRPRTSGCQQITFRSDGSLFISFQDDYQAMRNFTSNYTVVETTFTEAGYLRIQVPGGALGTGLSGDIKLYFIVAEDDHFVVATCEAIVLTPITIQLVHAFIPTSQLGVTTSAMLNSTLAATGKLEDLNSLREVNQACAATLRGPPNLLQIYSFLVKLGILPPLPFRSDSASRAQFYNALQNPPTSFEAPVQSIAYGQPPVTQPIPAVRPIPNYFYNAAPATVPYPGFPYQNQRSNYAPEVFYKPQTPTVYDYNSAFGSQQPGVTFFPGASQPIPAVRQAPTYFYSTAPAVSGYPGLTNQDQTPKFNDYNTAFGSQQFSAFN